MLTLAIDCALRRINLGASDGDNLLGELSVDVGMRQSELLPTAVRDFLSMAGKNTGEVEHVAVTVGPGYYTGIRVGLSYAAALAESVGTRVSGVSTLLAMALPLMESLRASGVRAIVAPVITAGRDSLYAAMYCVSSGEDEDVLLEPSHMGTYDFMNYATSRCSFDDIVITGFDLPPILSCAHHRIFPPLCVPRGVLAAARKTTPTDPSETRAVYLRQPC
jgi:tRNA threonylcarbamoyladenosine biosynthesis protein TsaB